MPQIVNTIFRTVADAETEQEDRVLKTTLSSNAMRNFVYRQLKAAKANENGLDPFNSTYTAEVYFQAAKDSRLLMRFWLEFHQYLDEISGVVMNINHEQES